MLMVIQMVIELIWQPGMDFVMRCHHLANMVVTVIYLVSPSFSSAIMTGLVVEIATLLRLVQRAQGKRAHPLLAFSFFASFYLTRFFFGWRWLVDGEYVWEHIDLTPGFGPAHADFFLRFGFAALLVIHGCGLWWGGMLWGILVNTLKNERLREKAELVGMLPSLVVVLLCGATRLQIATHACLVASSVCFHKLSAGSAHPRLFAAVKALNFLSMAAATYGHLDAAGGGNAVTLVMHAGAGLVCLCCVRDWTAHDNGPGIANMLVPLTLLNTLFCAPVSKVAVLLTPSMLMMTAILDLRQRKHKIRGSDGEVEDLRRYVALTMYVFNIWAVYYACWGAHLAEESIDPTFFQFLVKFLYVKVYGMSYS